MKKLIYICIIILFSIDSFAQEGRYGNLEIFSGMPFISGSLDYNGTESIMTELPFSFGIGYVNYNVFENKKFGIVFFGNFIFPNTFVHTANGQDNAYMINDITVLEVQLGIGYRLFQTDNVVIPITLGLHTLLLSGISRSLSTETHELAIYSFGLSGSVSFEWHVNSMIYFFARVHGVFDFITYTEHVIYTGVNIGGEMAYFIRGRDFFALSMYFGITPIIGFGLKFDGFLNTN